MTQQNGKVALVTGSSKGIGRAIALRLAQDGWDIIIHGRGPSEHLAETERLISKLGVECHPTCQDFSDSVDFESFVESAWQWKSRIDLCVNNAGGDVLTGPAANEPLESKLEFLWQVDVRATWLISRAVATRMAKRESPVPGTILNIGWDQAAQGMAGDSGELFSITKGAIMSMSKSMAQSFAPSVRVNCLAPGWIKTEWGENTSDYWSHRAQDESLMNRWGTPEDVANMAAFLASEKASFITGQVIPVNGGFRFGQPPNKK